MTTAWGDSPVPVRLAVIRRLRHIMSDRARHLAAASTRPGASEADILVSEVMPLLAACRFLEQRAARLLVPRREGRHGRPVWLFGTDLTIRRVPLGRVLVIGPANYPLLLPGVQALHALVAGNAVALKPAPGCAAPLALLAAMLAAAGLPDGTLTVLGDTADAARGAMAAGVDHVVLTGSAATGRAVQAALAERLIPSTMELSGRDPFVVLAGADVAHAARALVFGLAFNAGRTCIAPRRVIIVRDAEAAFLEALAPLLGATSVPAPDDPRVAAIIAAASGRIVGDPARLPLLIEAGVDACWPHEDLFAPVAAFTVVADEAAAVRLANAGPYALGAAVFGPAGPARDLAARLRAGCVLVGDVIAPTADPRLPFGGSGASGFGVTRGAEGLLAMTRPQAIVVRNRPERRHLTTLSGRAAPLVAAALRFLYGRRRIAAAAALMRALAGTRRSGGDAA